MGKDRKTGLGKFVLGAAIGAGLGILFAPKKGSETRKELKVKINELIANIKEIDVEEVKNALHTKLDELMREIEDLDKEKALKIAKEKGNQLKEKAEDIYNLAKEKGTPVLQKAASEVKKKTIDVVEEVLRKLKNEDKNN